MKKTTTFVDKISQINTHWTEIFAAHDEQGSQTRTSEAKQSVIDRYSSCIYYYLLGATHDQNTADELGQEFAFRFVRGDFRNVDPSKGRFRDYLKTALRNLVNDHFRQQKKTAAQRLEDHEQEANFDPVEELEKKFATHWRQALIGQAWEALAELEQRKSNAYHTVLKFRADHPEMNSIALAAALTEQIGEAVSPEWVRQKIHRAREKFASFLLIAVKQTLPSDSPEAVEHELAELHLLKYVEVSDQSS